MKFLAATLALHVMSRAQLTELMVLFVVGSALTLAVFFLALLLLPLRRLIRFPSRDFLGFSDFGRVGAARDLKKLLADRTFVQKLSHDKRIQPAILQSSRRFLLKL